MNQEQRMQQESRAIWATVICFLAGTGIGTAVLWGNPRPIAGDGSVSLPVALVAGVVAAASFVVSTFLNRRGEHASMPRWQTIISASSAVALTIAFAGVTALGVLLASEVLGVGLQGVVLPALGGGIVTGVASAVAGRLTFGAGIGLHTADLAALLFSYLMIGTLFAMLTAADPRWWETNFSQLGIGVGAWVFNGTLVVAGILTATVGAYIGRDLHRILGDAALGRIVWVVVLWTATGVALAGVGLFPQEDIVVLHNIAAVSTLVLFVAAGVLTTTVMPGPPRPLLLTTVGVALLLVIAFVGADSLDLYSITVLEAIVIGLGLLWLTTLVRVLAVLTPDVARPSARESLLHG
ncbi:DUF998 domain-containing protein [Microbacterium murale]|uniref:DUF998 domain-containing protein n=1 Tax=Microbacterium murale TaxID=1081040 RepID=A0ABU0P992_9MICO|nr:DUF998 domain-containing protein [Microbacterium murale]MDQ0643895.1 hypothetical protein [Microbacterium murale]